MEFATPARSVQGSFLPRIRWYLEGFQGGLEAIFKAQLWSSSASVAICEFTIQQLFWDAIFVHASYVSSPSCLCSLQQTVDSGHVGACENLGVGDFVLPFHSEYSAEAR